MNNDGEEEEYGEVSKLSEDEEELLETIMANKSFMEKPTFEIELAILVMLILIMLTNINHVTS